MIYRHALSFSLDKLMNIDPYSAIPQSMRDRTQWLLWNLDNDTDKNGVTIKKKVPYTVTGPHVHKAGSTNLKHYRTYRQVCAYLEQYKERLTGLGFALADGITGVDLDGCRDATTGVIADWAMTIITLLNSYTELSPSGTGVHIFCLGTVIDGKNKRLPELNKRAGIEMYSNGKYFTVSGKHLPGTPLEVMARQDDLDALYHDYFVQTPTQANTRPLAIPSGFVALSDDDLINRAMKANKFNITSLWNGDISAYGNDDSVADLALCNLLAYWTGKDASRMDSLFRQSRLMRDKWDERRGDSTWGATTINKAIRDYPYSYTYTYEYTLPQLRNIQRVDHNYTPQDDSETPQVLQTEPADFKSELGNAHKFIKQYGDRVRYVYTAKKWMYYDGTRWVYDTSGQVRRWAKACVISLLHDAANYEDDNQRKAMVKHAMTSQSNKSITGMLTLAESEQPLQLDELDTNPWLLNVKNGTFNLETNTLQPHNRLDYISKIANVTYDPKATAPTWDTFLAWATCDDAELATFLQRSIGYGITGVIRENAMFIPYGLGANGKSTLFTTLQNLLGDYAQSMKSESLMIQNRNGGGANSDIAALRGARFVVSSEGEENTRLAESLVKMLTGGDVMRARYLYGEEFDFFPSHKLFFFTNHKPVIRGTDNGIWRRMKLIPFNAVIETQNQDTHLPVKLAKEGEGILNWIINGCQQWQQNGLGTSQAVTQATQGYRNEMDVMAAFLTDCCITTLRQAEAITGELYRSYVKWCEENGEHAMSQRRFGGALKDRGFINQKGTAGIRKWIGIGLLNNDDKIYEKNTDNNASTSGASHVFSKTFPYRAGIEKVYVKNENAPLVPIQEEITNSFTDSPPIDENTPPSGSCPHCGANDYRWIKDYSNVFQNVGMWECKRCHSTIGSDIS